MEEQKKSSETAWWQPALVLFIRLSIWIAFPVIIAVFIGKWLDKKYQTEPWLFLLCVGIAFVVSMVIIVKKAVSEMKKIDAENKEDKQPKEDV